MDVLLCYLLCSDYAALQSTEDGVNTSRMAEFEIRRDRAIQYTMLSSRNLTRLWYCKKVKYICELLCPTWRWFASKLVIYKFHRFDMGIEGKDTNSLKNNSVLSTFELANSNYTDSVNAAVLSNESR